jgi:hypothetical protein
MARISVLIDFNKRNLAIQDDTLKRYFSLAGACLIFVFPTPYPQTLTALLPPSEPHGVAIKNVSNCVTLPFWL